jgi:hypothetical protein
MPVLPQNQSEKVIFFIGENSGKLEQVLLNKLRDLQSEHVDGMLNKSCICFLRKQS